MNHNITSLTKSIVLSSIFFAFFALRGQEAREEAPLSRTTVTVGPTKLIFERLAPPTPASVPHSESHQSVEAHAQRPFLSLSCTVYDHDFTELRWTWQGNAYTAKSVLNFHLLEGVGSFSWAGRTYDLFLSVGDESSSEIAANRQSLIAQGVPDTALPEIPSPPDGAAPERLGFQIVQSDTPTAVGGLQALTDLHQFVKANLTSLENGLKERETARAANALKPVPKVEPPTEVRIQFWPIESSRYPSLPSTTLSPQEGKP